MSFVDPYQDRVFRNGRVYGVNYNEMTNQPTYTDISPFGGGRMAGKGLDLEPDVVIYMGKAAQGMPQDQGMDVRIAEGMLKAMGRAIEPVLYRPDQDRAELRTLEYVPERDGPATPEPIGPYNADTDKSELIQLLAGGNFMGGSGSQIGPRPKGLKGITREALESLPNSGIAKEKYMKIRQGIDLPRV
tara:strand:+ start:64 stop:627 length:564 start_codon:yes stop_codon:yes gene_type:complete